MLEVNVDPLIGALIMWNSAWEKIDPADREKVAAAAKVLENKLQTEIPAQDAKSVADMQKLGLKVTKLDAAAAAAFHAEAEKLTASMEGKMVPADVYQLAIQARDEYRKTHAR
jgi:TRAP-type C4-dicarboxylate transport system substrate-binding protein